jgi:hypothetical protein
MGGIFGLGNSSAKTDRGRALGGWNAMWDVWNKSMGTNPAAMATASETPGAKAGESNLDFASDFWKSVLTGGKGPATAAAAPAINATNAQADQKRMEQAQMGTARGGGTAGYNTQAEVERGADVQNALFGMIPAAAQQIEQIGGSQAQIGQRQLALALEQLGVSQAVARDIVTTSMQSRTDSQSMSPARIGETAILSMIGL